MYDTYVSNFYDNRRDEFYNLEFRKLSNSVLINCNILPSSRSLQVMCINMFIRNIHKKKKMHQKKIDWWFNRDHWPESIKQEFLWFLFKDVLSFMAKNIP